MFLFKADLSFENTHRQTPITGNTYRPLFFFSDKVVRSGLIVLSDGESLEMTHSYKHRLVKIYFYKDLDVDGEFYAGRTFTMAEGGSAIIGRGVITEVIGEEELVPA